MKRKILVIALFTTCSFTSYLSAIPNDDSFFERIEDAFPFSLEDMNQASTYIVDNTCQAATSLKKIAIKHPVFSVLTIASIMGKERIKACLQFAKKQPFLIAVAAIVVASTQTSYTDTFIQKVQSFFPS